MNLFNILLFIHIACGSLAIITSLGAISSTKGERVHRLLGRYFFYAMTGIFFTAVPLSWLINSPFLFCIALFSYYLAFTGWRYALRRTLPASILDNAVALIMLLVSLVMISFALVKWDLFAYKAIVLLVFGLSGARFSFSDLWLFRKESYPKHERMVRHVGAMMGATIAVFTAVLVVNVHLSQEWIVWLGPTVVFLPLIIYWTGRVKKNRIS